MLSISGMLRKIALMERSANAEHNLKTYMGAYIRPEFNKAIDYGSILRSSEIKIPSEEFKEHYTIEDIQEDLVDRFIDHKMAREVRALMKAHSTKYGPKAEKLIDSVEPLDTDEKELVKEMVKDLAPLASKYIRTDFLHGYKDWLFKHKRESPMLDSLKEPSVPPEHEVEEEVKKKHEWEEGLIKDTLSLINRKFPHDHHMMKMILKDIFLARNPKNQGELAKELNVSDATITRHIKELQKVLKDFYIAQGLGGKFLEDGGLVKKEIEIPKYVEYMKDSENTKEFKEFIEPKIRTNMSERTLKVVDLFAEGLTYNDIASKLEEPANKIRELKTRYFDPWYKEWYEEKVEEIRKACIEESLMATLATTVRVPYNKVDDKGEPKKEKEKEVLEEANQAHKKIVDRAFKNGDVVVVIGFHSEYDNTQVLSGKKDVQKDPPHFRFESFVASIDESRVLGKSERSVEYRYHQKLNDDGTFIGRGDSLLKLDGGPINDELKKEIDEYVENKIKPEGVFPHGHFSTMYKNSKNDKMYPGVRTFVEHFRGILTWDLVHKQRMNSWEKLQLKKQIGNISEDAEEKAKKTLFKIREDLKIEKGNRPELKDHERIVHLEKMERELQEYLKSKNTTDQDLDEITKRENEYLESIKLAMAKLADSYGQFGNLMPPPKREGMLKLLDIFKEYKVDSPNPKMWLEASDLDVLARVLKTSVDNKIQLDLKELKDGKSEGDVRNTKIHEIAEKHSENLSKAVGYFKEIPADLKDRRDEFEKKHPDQFAQFKKRKDTTWVENKEKIDHIMGRVRKALLEKSPVEELKQKERGVKIIEKSKYRSLEAFLEAELHGVYIIGQTLTHAGLKSESMETEAKEKIVGEINRSTEELKKVQETLKALKELPDIEQNKEEEKKIKDALSDPAVLMQSLQAMRNALVHGERHETIPAYRIAKVLDHKLDYFSKLYSKLIGILWFRDKPIIQSADEDAGEITGTQENLKGRIVHSIGKLTSKNIFSRDSLKANLTDSRKLIEKFISSFTVHKEILSSDCDQVFYRLASDFDNARIKAIFPASELAHAKHLIEYTLGKSDKKQVRALAPMAQEEFDKILKNVSEAYKDAFTTERIKALAKRDNLPFEQASVRLKRLEDAMAKAAVGGFLVKWEDYFDNRNKVKDRSDLGNRPGKEYEKIGAYVERHIPELFELSPSTDDLPVEPSRGIPTPTKIRELLEDQFSKKDLDINHLTEDQEEEIFFDSEYFHGGGGGGKSKGRKKAPKIPPVSGVHEVLKARFLQVYKSKSSKEIVVDNYMHSFTIKIKDFVKGLKEGEYVEVDAVIDGYVHMLKNLYHMILGLKVEPSTSSVKHLPPGAPMFTGKPDIPVDSEKEAEQIYNKLIEIYKWINFYIEPDKVGVPSENISKLTSHSGINKKFMPNYLLDWYATFKDQNEGKTPKSPYHAPEEEKAPEHLLIDKDKHKIVKHEGPNPKFTGKAGSFPMSFRVMAKFAGTGIQDINRTEKDAISSITHN